MDIAPESELDPLTCLAIKYGTDKWGLHFYTPHYHEWLGHWRERPLRLLEIGVGGYDDPQCGGQSLAMWAEYFPHARIVGIDVAPKTLRLDPRIAVLQGSQEDARFLDQVVATYGPFDIVIDDGSHVPAHVVASFQALFPGLADGGIYVIEDVQTTFGGSALNGGGTMQLAQTLLSYINHAEIRVERPTLAVADWATKVRAFHAVHNLFMIEKGANDEPSNFAYDPDNRHVRKAMDIIERQMREAPTPEGIAGFLDVCNAAGQRDRARGLVEAALARWPEHPVLQAALARMQRQ